MKPKFKKYIPHTLALLLIASSPLSVLSNRAYATTLENLPKQEAKEVPLLGDRNEYPSVPALPEETEPVVTENEGVPESVPSIPKPLPTPVPKPPVNPTPPTVPVKPSTTIEERFKLAENTMTKTKNYVDKRDLVDNAIDGFKKEQSKDKLQLAIDYAVLLPYAKEGIYTGDKEYFYNTLLPLIEFIKDPKEEETIRFHFTQKAIIQLNKTLGYEDMELAKNLVKTLPKGSKADAMKKELDKAIQKVFDPKNQAPESDINWDHPGIEYDTGNDSNGDNWEPGFDPVQYEKDNPPFIPGADTFQEGYSSTVYKNENGACYQTTYQYSTNGELLSKKRAKTQNASSCSTEFVGQGNIPQNYYNEDWKSKGVGVAISRDSDKPYSEQVKSDLLDKDKTKLNTIQYTFEKEADSPYYYDTGIVIQKDGTIAYEDARDALYQIAIQAKGKYVEDERQALALLDGLIILVQNQNKPVKFNEFSNLFNETSVGLKSQGTRNGLTAELIDLIEIKSFNTAIVKKKEVSLVSSPIVDDQAVLFPLEQLAVELGGSVSSEENKTTIEYKGNRISFADGQSVHLKNSHSSAKTRMNQQGIIMADVQAITEFFDVKLEVDSSQQAVIIQ